jgi:shikimate dehydrogenase
MDRYVVIGNPVAHSLSPTIHAHFARDGRGDAYDRLLLERDARVGCARFSRRGCGANVTLFKLEAFALRLARAERGRGEFLCAAPTAFADNTDGAGPLRSGTNPASDSR